MFNTANYQRNANQNQNEVPPQGLVRMTIIKQSTKNKYWRAYGEKGILLHCWWESKFVYSLGRTVQRFLKKLKIELSYDPEIPLLGIYLEKAKIHAPQCSVQHLFTIAKIWKQPKCPSTDEWIKKMCTYIQWNLLSHK